MTLRILRFAPVLLLAGGFGLATGVWSVFDHALAEAGGNGKGVGQGGARGGANNGGGPAASAQGLAKGPTKNSFQANSLGRLNSLIHASDSAWQNAKGNSPMGIISGEYTDCTPDVHLGRDRIAYDSGSWSNPGQGGEQGRSIARGDRSYTSADDRGRSDHRLRNSKRQAPRWLRVQRRAWTQRCQRRRSPNS